MKIGLFLLGLFTGAGLGFAVAAWALYEPVHPRPAKYAFTRSAGPVAPYTMDGTQKLFRIECISESEKDCPQPHIAVAATQIPEPGTLGLMMAGMVAIAGVRRA